MRSFRESLDPTHTPPAAQPGFGSVRSTRRRLIRLTGGLAAACVSLAGPLARADLVYVSLSDNTIVTYDTTSNVNTTIEASRTVFANTNLSTPGGLTFDASGNLYAANIGDNTVSKFNSTGTYVSNISTNLASPIFTTFDAAGNLYASNYGDDTISKFNSAGVYQSNITTNLSDPVGLDFDSSGNLYVANNAANTISKFDPNGGFLGTFANTNIQAPAGLILDAANNVYIANQNAGVSEFNPSGGFVGQTLGPPNGPWGLAFDSASNFYVSYYLDSQISKFDSNGTRLVTWSTSTTQPTGVAVNVVPEPGTAGLVAIGVIGLAAAAGRARWRRSMNWSILPAESQVTSPSTAARHRHGSSPPQYKAVALL